MTEQLPFHWRDPDTSRIAAANATPGAASHRKRILAWLYERGDLGGTAYEAWQATGGARPTGAGTRLLELSGENSGRRVVDVPLVYKSMFRRPTDTGSPAVVWKLTPEGVREALRARAAA